MLVTQPAHETSCHICCGACRQELVTWMQVCADLPVLTCFPAFFPAGVVVISTSIPSKFQTREYRFMRAIIFTMLGGWGVVPVAHLLFTHGHVWAIRTAFQLDMLMGLIYLVSS
jgi:hypothetical protein